MLDDPNIEELYDSGAAAKDEFQELLLNVYRGMYVSEETEWWDNPVQIFTFEEFENLLNEDMLDLANNYVSFKIE